MTVLQTFKTTQETTMDHGTKTLQLPELTSYFDHCSGRHVMGQQVL